MKKIFYLFLVIVMTAFIIPVNAKDNFYAKEDLKLNKEYDSTVFAAGNNVKATGKVDGISFIAGNNVKVENERDYLFVAGNIININNVTTKDAFIAGSNITIENSTIRDLYIAADQIKIDSDIDGKAYIGGNIVAIDSTIKGDVKISAEEIYLGENANIEGKLIYPEDCKLKKDETAKVAKEKKYKVSTSAAKENAKTMFMDFIMSLLSMILIGVVLLALNQNVFDKISKLDKDASNIAKKCLLGFAFLILVPIASIILIASTIGLGLGIICILLYGIMFYISVIPTAYFLGNWLAKDKIENKYLLLTLSLLIIHVLRLIPIVGGIVTFLSLCFGLGVYTSLLKEKINTK